MTSVHRRLPHHRQHTRKTVTDISRCNHGTVKVTLPGVRGPVGVCALSSNTFPNFLPNYSGESARDSLSQARGETVFRSVISASITWTLDVSGVFHGGGGVEWNRAIICGAWWGRHIWKEFFGQRHHLLAREAFMPHVPERKNVLETLPPTRQ